MEREGGRVPGGLCTLEVKQLDNGKNSAMGPLFWLGGASKPNSGWIGGWCSLLFRIASNSNVIVADLWTTR